MQDDGKAAVAKARELTRGYLSGRAGEAVDAFRGLVDHLLRITVLHPERGTVHRSRPAGDRKAFVIGGPPQIDGSPVLLSNDAYLGLHIQVELADTTEGKKRLTVAHLRYQYQIDEAGKNWVFRYDYIRDPLNHHPCGHLHVRADPPKGCPCLPPRATFERVHFPTGRVSLEAVIRLLVEHFGIRTATPDKVWWPCLFAAENAFLDVAQTPTNPRHASAPPRNTRRARRRP